MTALPASVQWKKPNNAVRNMTSALVSYCGSKKEPEPYDHWYKLNARSNTGQTVCFVNVFLLDVKEKFSFAFGCCWEGERTTDFNI